MENNTTSFFQPVIEPDTQSFAVLRDVILSLEEKGYSASNQLAGFLLSGDPTYITSFNNSRSKITSVSRDELVSELIRGYVEHYQIGNKEN